MKHTTSRMLFAYWDALRGERVAPDRSAVQPADMRHILADAFVLADDERQGAAFRLAGSRACALFGRDLKGRPFADLWPRGARQDGRHLVEIVTGDTVGLVAGLAAKNANGSEVALELVLLPLRHRGRTDTRLLGTLSPATVPPWAGLVPIDRLETRGVRIIRSAREPDERRTAEGQAPTRRRNLFVVHEGGRGAS